MSESSMSLTYKYSMQSIMPERAVPAHKNSIDATVGAKHQGRIARSETSEPRYNEQVEEEDHSCRERTGGLAGKAERL